MLHKIGFIGLGTIGRHMAVNLVKGEYDVTVFDTDPAKVAIWCQWEQRALSRLPRRPRARSW